MFSAVANATMLGVQAIVPALKGPWLNSNRRYAREDL